MTLVKELRERADSYRLSGSSAEHTAALLDRAAAVIDTYERMHEQHREHVRRLDVALNGDGAAKQASLIDLVAQFERRLKVG